MLIMAVGNNRFAGGGFAVAPQADLRDGLFDLAILSDFPASTLPELIREMSDISKPDNRYTTYRQLSDFVLEADTEVHFNVDGAPVRTSKMAFSVLPRTLPVAIVGQP